MHSWVGAIAFVWIERRRRRRKTKETHDRIGTCWCNEFRIRNCFGFGFIFSFSRCKTRSANIVRAGVWVCVHISCLCVFKYCKNYYYSNLILMPCSQTKWVLVRARARRDCRRNQIKLCGQTKIVVWTFPPTKLHRELPLVLRLNDVTERERERAKRLQWESDHFNYIIINFCFALFADKNIHNNNNNNKYPVLNGYMGTR